MTEGTSRAEALFTLAEQELAVLAEVRDGEQLAKPPHRLRTRFDDVAEVYRDHDHFSSA